MIVIRTTALIVLSICLSSCSTVKKEPLSAASLAIQGVQFFFSPIVPERVTVTSIGTGNTREEAVQNALITAMQEGVGVLVVSEVATSGNKVTRDIVAQYSSAIVKSYDVNKCVEKTKVQCEIDAIVTPWTFYEALHNSSNTLKIDGKSLHAQHLTQQYTLQQRKRLTEYFFSKIRVSGLDARILKVKVMPSESEKVHLHLRYQVRYKREFWTELEGFLRRLERDTGGSFSSYDEHRDVAISWGGGSFKRVFIKTDTQSFWELIQEYRIGKPILVSIPELHFCDRIELGDSYKRGFFGDIFQIDFYGLNREHRIRVQPEQLKGVNGLTLKMGC